MDSCYKCNTPLPGGSRFCLSCGADVSGESTDQGVPLRPARFDVDLGAVLRTDVQGQFTVERELGRGGMGAVFLATETQLGRKVAIKVLPPELTFSPAAVERFKREARTAATLDHPHIIPIYRVSGGDTVFWYAMKYLEGESLAALIEREVQLTLETTAVLIGQVAEALDYAHQHGVIHRDVKPPNIVIDGRGWVTVMDFGSAKAIGAESITGSGSMIGTPYYMSPEQCSGKPVTAASDQYSLGVVAFQMLSGQLPFAGDSVIDVVRQHCIDPVPPLGVLRPQVTPNLQAVVERALAKAPGERFPSVSEFADAFARSARGERVSVEGPGARATRVRRRNITAVGVGGAVVVVALGVLLWPNSPARQDAPRPGVGAPAVAADSAKAASPSPVQPVQPARFTLRGVPAGAVVMVDGQRWRGAPGDPIPLAPGAPRGIQVSAAGFVAWRVSVTGQPGEILTRTVPPLQPDTGRASPAAGGDFGWISVGSRPASVLSVNGQLAGPTPRYNVRVAAGAVRLLFQVTDTTGTWQWDTTVTVARGDTVRLGLLRLVKR